MKNIFEWCSTKNGYLIVETPEPCHAWGISESFRFDLAKLHTYPEGLYRLQREVDSLINQFVAFLDTLSLDDMDSQMMVKTKSEDFDIQGFYYLGRSKRYAYVWRIPKWVTKKVGRLTRKKVGFTLEPTLGPSIRKYLWFKINSMIADHCFAEGIHETNNEKGLNCIVDECKRWWNCEPAKGSVQKKKRPKVKPKRKKQDDTVKVLQYLYRRGEKYWYYRCLPAAFKKLSKLDKYTVYVWLGALGDNKEFLQKIKDKLDNLFDEMLVLLRGAKPYSSKNHVISFYRKAKWFLENVPRPVEDVVEAGVKSEKCQPVREKEETLDCTGLVAVTKPPELPVIPLHPIQRTFSEVIEKNLSRAGIKSSHAKKIIIHFDNEEQAGTVEVTVDDEGNESLSMDTKFKSKPV
jgi:hypothetical protein